MGVSLVDLGAAEEALAQLLQAGTGEGGVEADAPRRECQFPWKFEPQRAGCA